MTLPKGIHISREGLFYMVDEIAERTGITEADRVLSIAHTTGLLPSY